MCEGGPLVTETGGVIGINFLGDFISAHTLPTPIILSCLEMWTSFRCDTYRKRFYNVFTFTMSQRYYFLINDS